MAHDSVHDDDVAEVTHLTAEAASALIRGDIPSYLMFIRHADDCTLLQPFGAQPRRGFDSSDEALEARARFFRAGEADVEVVESYASAELVVQVVIERQHGEVGDLPDQDWSLRVTLVLRNEASGGWPTPARNPARPITFGQAAALARGSLA